MNNIFNKIFNWFFGSFFRTMGRFLFYFLLAIFIYFIFSKFGVRVYASSKYSYSSNPNYLYTSIEGLPHSNESNTCVNGQDIENINNVILQKANFTDDLSSMGILYSHGTNASIYKIDDIYTNLNNSNVDKIFYHISLGVARSNFMIPATGQKKYFAFLIASDKIKVFDSLSYINNKSKVLSYFPSEGVFKYLNYDNSLSFISNGGNLAWAIFEVNITSAIYGLGFDLYVSPSLPIVCTNKNDDTYGLKWVQVLDYRVFDSASSFDESELHFKNIVVDENNFYCPDGLDCSKYNEPETPVEPEPPVDVTNEDINDSINNITDNIMDPSSPDITGLEEAPGWLPAGPLDSVINLPINILNNLNNHLNGTCKAFTFTIPFINKSFSIPCISDLFNKIKGLGVFLDFIGTIAGGLLMYNYLVYLYNWVDDITSLKHFKARMFGAKSDIENWAGVD